MSPSLPPRIYEPSSLGILGLAVALIGVAVAMDIYSNDNKAIAIGYGFMAMGVDIIMGDLFLRHESRRVRISAVLVFLAVTLSMVLFASYD